MKLLLVDDDPVSLRRLSAILGKEGYIIDAVENGQEAWEEIISDNPPDIAVLDWMMPGYNGVELCRMVRKRKRQKYLYIIFLTSKDTAEDIVEGLDAGADDYIKKPFNPQELKVRIRVGKRILELQSEVLTATEMLRHRALYDSLTGVMNRQEIINNLDHEVSKWQRYQQHFSVIMSDIDNFKKFNDEHGHIVGDQVLRQVGELLRANLRSYTIIGRYGGEEFIIIVPMCTLPDAATIAERIRAKVHNNIFVTEAGNLHVSMSFGVSSTEIVEPVDGNEMIRSADKAMYQAKRQGRNLVVSAESIGNL